MSYSLCKVMSKQIAAQSIFSSLWQNCGKYCLVIVILAILPLINGCAGAPPPSAELEIVKHSLDRGDSGNAKVLITVKNSGSSVIELAEVTVIFYDAQGNPISSTSDAVMNLEPRATWDFIILCTAPISH